MLPDTADAIAAAFVARNAWSDWSDRGSLAVLAGVVLEIIDLESVSTRIGLHKRPIIKDTIAAIGLVLVVSGLSMEYRAGIKIHDRTVTIERNLGVQALADARAAATVGHSALIDADAAASTATSAQARANTASDELDRIKQRENVLRAQIGTDEHILAVAKAQLCASALEIARTQREMRHRPIDQIQLKAALSGFNGFNVYLDNQGDAEYTLALTDSLNLAHINVKPLPMYLPGVNTGRMAGITIEYWTDQPTTGAAGVANALSLRMKQDGVDVGLVGLRPGPVNKVAQHIWPPEVPHEAVLVLIGPTKEHEAVAHERAGDLAAYGAMFAPTKPPCDTK